MVSRPSFSASGSGDCSSFVVGSDIATTSLRQSVLQPFGHESSDGSNCRAGKHHHDAVAVALPERLTFRAKVRRDEADLLRAHQDADDEESERKQNRKVVNEVAPGVIDSQKGLRE